MNKTNLLKTELAKVGNTTKCPAIVVVKNEKILMGYRHYTPDKWKDISVWVLPGGRCDDNETIESAIRRETMEETGITNLKIEDYIGEVVGVAKESDSVPLFYGSTEQEFKLMEPDKFSEWRWVAVEDYLSGFPDFVNESAYKMICSYLKN